MNFSNLVGRKFEVYTKNIEDVHSGIKGMTSCNLVRLYGTLVNFSPATHLTIDDDVCGFNIIPYECIVQMCEVKNKN